MKVIANVFGVLVFLLGVATMPLPAAEAADDDSPSVEEQLRDARARIKVLEERAAKLQAELAELVAEKTAEIVSAAKVETEYARLKVEYEDLEADHVKEVEERRDAQSALNATLVLVGELRKEVKQLRAERHVPKGDESLKQVVRLIEELYAARLKLPPAESSPAPAAPPDPFGPPRRAPVPDPFGAPPADKVERRIEGVVTAVGENLLQISLGSDKGLVKGGRLEVYRVAGGSKTYLGRIEATHIGPDQSACRLLPGHTEGKIQKGDQVTTLVKDVGGK